MAESMLERMPKSNLTEEINLVELCDVKISIDIIENLIFFKVWMLTFFCTRAFLFFLETYKMIDTCNADVASW